MLLHKRFVTFSGMSGAQAAAEATEATAEILVESYLDLVGEGEVVRLFCFLPLCLRMVREKHWFF